MKKVEQKNASLLVSINAISKVWKMFYLIMLTIHS